MVEAPDVMDVRISGADLVTDASHWHKLPVPAPGTQSAEPGTTATA